MRGIERVTAPGIFLHYLMRKLFIEEAVRRSLATPASARQVVVIGAGLDTLGARLALDGANNVRVVEVDHPATQAVKRRALARYGLPREGFSFVELDRTVRTLAEALGDSDQLDPRLPAVFVAEGLLMYLTPERAADFFREVHQISAPGSRLVFTVMESDRSDRILERRTSQEHPSQHHQRYREIDHQPRHVYQRRDEWGGCARGVEADPPEHERKHRAHHRPKGHHADERESHCQCDEVRLERDPRMLVVVLTELHAEKVRVVIVQVLPELDAREADHAEDDPKGEPGRHFASGDAPPIPDPHFSQRERPNHQ